MPLDDFLIPYQLHIPKEALDEPVIPNALRTDKQNGCFKRKMFGCALYALTDDWVIR